MLEQFKVNHDDAEFVQGDDLKKTVAGIFEKLGVPAEDALLAADVQVLADLRGVDSKPSVNAEIILPLRPSESLPASHTARRAHRSMDAPPPEVTRRPVSCI